MGKIRSIAEAAPQKLIERVIQKKMTMEEVASELHEHYKGLDVNARRQFQRTALTMFANYENKWSGDVNLITGQWEDSIKNNGDVDFTVPLLTSLVDTHTTFYTKTTPKYVAKPIDRSSIAQRTAKMCQEIGQSELDRMLSYPVLQRESQYMTLATVSYRRLEPTIVPHSPTVISQTTEVEEHEVTNVSCDNCGYEGEEQEVGENPSCPECMGPMAASTAMKPKEVVRAKKERLPRLRLSVPNPVYIQTDFNATDFREAKFAIKRKRIPKHTAEFYYQIDLTDADTSDVSVESRIDEMKMREGIGRSGSYLPLSVESGPNTDRWKRIEETDYWLDPCEYGLYFVNDALLQEKYPDGLFMKIVGNVLVQVRPAVKNEELIRVQQGIRPASNTGMGMVHLAEMNDLINNEISLEYSILMTYGFPLQLLRGKYLKELPAALQTFVINNIPDTMPLEDLIHRETPSNTSGMLGVLSQRVEGYMQQIAGSFTSAGVSPQLKQMMGTATGASAIQEMMSDRMGLSVQMRVDADIQTLVAILKFFQRDPRNRQWLLECGYDETVVDYFYNNDLDGMFYFEPAKGTDEPMLDSVNTFKVQSFASLVAPLTGLRQSDPAMFYDIVDEMGKALNIPVGVGAGRKEKNMADSRIDRVLELYKVQKDNPVAAQMDPVNLGQSMFKAVMLKEQMMIQSIVGSQMMNGPQPATPEEKQVAAEAAGMLSSKLEAYLYDYGALQEAYSDWLQSEVGQSSDMPVQIAVGLLFSHALDMMDKRREMDTAKQLQTMQAAGMMTGDPTAAEDTGDPTNPPGPAKRDGTSGPGRPREVHAPEA